ncbi:TonB-dependent receptor [Bowmanella pacifica]|uniref:TonB-dependent receptor n=1 Tax=Bowmanella pacifica TaxID=502051 RepID=A0A917Z3N7_9ALTE|nr:TonB-dependent receptor [Bowmanella pacifica]GGO74217.1 hypothetical protein GCM10010982_36530 [Bowmanella pacifica]
MVRKHLIAISLSSLFSATAIAQSLQGQVVDESGQPISGASVQLHGVYGTQVANEQGQFSYSQVREGKVELHVSAPGFAHKSVRLNIPSQGLADVRVVLLDTSIEVVDVTASPFHASAIESALPVTVLSGDKLRNKQASTLGDTLAGEVGVHSNFHGSVASTPIIRGLDGPRVLITQNGLDAGDASRVGPDHAVSAEASTATQIEVLRGPATLFYGSGAIGGVVNVVDNRVPTDNQTRGEWTLEHTSVNDQKLAAFNLNSGLDRFALHLDGYWRESDDYKVPGPAEQGIDDGADKVKNSAAQSHGFTLGGSYLLDNGYVGISYGRLDREYGVPGHSHGDEDVAVTADMQQDRVQLLSELRFEQGFISAIRTKLSYTDYEHAEIESGLVGTTFANESKEARVEFLHNEVLGWHGGLSLHYKRSDFAATGAEAFTPPSVTDSLALALMEERHFGPLLAQLGARIERVTLKADNVLFPEAVVHAHGDEGHEDLSHGDQVIRRFTAEHEFEPYSLSAGLVWDFSEGYNLGLSLSHSQRAPAASELLSFGPHIGTGSYEVGALFKLYQDEHGDAYLGLTDQAVDLESANNLDLTLRKFSGDLGFILNGFYNRVDNYYYQQNTGLFAESGHDHSHDHDHDHDHGDEELPVYLFAQDDVVLHGFESQLFWQFLSEWKLTLQGDYVRARLQDGGDLPRTPPLRLGANLAYEGQSLSGDLGVTRYFNQDRTAALESDTDGYTLVDLNLTYHLGVSGHELAIYLKGHNLTDEEARPHTSFLKHLAPLPGRSVALGIRGYF